MEIKFLSKTNLVTDIWEFHFTKPPAFTFTAGDYVDFGFPDVGAHWLTIASSPEENELIFVVRIRTQPSIFKKRMSLLKPGDKCIISPAIGSFNLPRAERKLLFIALGIGIVPYRSMLEGKPTNPSDITLLYTAHAGEFIFEDIITASKIHYIKRETRLTVDEVPKLANDYKDHLIYLAGPELPCQQIYAELLHEGIPRMQLKLEYFTGER